MKASTYVAFLRGVNVGGNTIISMEELRKAFASLGFANVRTILASGNVVFEKALEKHFGKHITTRTWNTVQRIAAVLQA